jgi:hypothetical protein
MSSLKSQFDNHFYENVDKYIIGWTVSEKICPLLALIDQIQQKKKCSGNVAEIGIHHGKSFIPLAKLCRGDEQALAVDCFDDQSKNIDKSGKGDKKIFLEHCKKAKVKRKVVVLSKDSNKLRPKGIKGALKNDLPIRLFSVDGSHTKQCTHHDLRLASNTMHDLGVIIIDDYLHLHWPGVRAGVDAFLGERNDWRPFYLGYNKLFLCRSKYYKLFWKVFENIETDIRNGCSNLYAEHPKNIQILEKRMWIGGVWKNQSKSTPI